MNVAFPAINAAFGLAIDQIQWIILAYVIAQSSFTLAFGKLGDLLGHRRMFVFGMAACALAHLLCAVAPTYPALVVLRVVQGVAVGVAMASAPAIATLLYPPEQKRQVLATYLTLLGVGFAAGPLAGGVLVDRFGWPGVFWVRVPIALAALVLSIGLVDPAQARKVRPRIDYLGATLLTAVLACCIPFVSVWRSGAWGLAMVQFAVGLAALVLFVRHERRFPEPILRMSHFADRYFGRLQLAAVAISGCCFSIVLLLPYWLAVRSTPQTIGFLLALFPLGALAASFASGRLPRAVTLSGGLALAAAGLLAVATTIAFEGGHTLLGFALFATGAGLGAFQLSYMDDTTSILPIEERGVAGSLFTVTRAIGFVAGAAGISTLYAMLEASLGAARAYSIAFAILGMTLAAFAVGFALLGRERLAE